VSKPSMSFVQHMSAPAAWRALRPEWPPAARAPPCAASAPPRAPPVWPPAPPASSAPRRAPPCATHTIKPSSVAPQPAAGCACRASAMISLQPTTHSCWHVMNCEQGTIPH
jgi:hypothetical protein